MCVGFTVYNPAQPASIEMKLDAVVSFQQQASSLMPGVTRAALWHECFTQQTVQIFQE